MNYLNAPPTVSFKDIDTPPNYFKSIINFVNVQTQLYPNNPFIRYMSNDRSKSLTYAEADRITTNLACSWFSDVQNTDPVAFIGDLNAPYLLTMLAFMKLRITLLCISPRNSITANVNLLEKTKCRLLFSESRFQAIAQGTVEKMDGTKAIVLAPMDIDTLRNEPLNPDYKRILNLKFTHEDIDKSVLILHSSGTTSLPKPMYLSNRYVLLLVNCIHVIISTESDSQKLSPKDVLLCFAPLCHIFGLASIFSTVSNGSSIAFAKSFPPHPNDIYDAMIKHKVTYMSTPPLILEHFLSFIQKTGQLSLAQSLKYIFYAGAPLTKDLAQWCFNNEVKLASIYGATEFGGIMVGSASRKNKGYGSVRPFMPGKNGQHYCCFEVDDPSTPDIYHFYIHSDYPGLADVPNRSDGGYSSNDLFKKDPENPGYYVYVGRRNDILVMKNGEKASPLPMEAVLRQSRVIKQAAVLGHGRQCTCALIELDKEVAFDYSPDEIIEEVHKAVKEANLECPTHSALLPQIVKILPFNKQLPSTDKGTVKRKDAEQMYQAIVDKMYMDFLEGPNQTHHSATGSVDQVQDFVIKCVSDVLNLPKSEIKDLDQPVFDLGVTSITAIQLRNKLSEQFGRIHSNFVFQYPSIHTMVKVLESGETEDLSDLVAKSVQRTQDLAVSYIKKAQEDFPVAVNHYDTKADKVVLLTGVTGALGSLLLNYLLRDTNVKKVYCCVRGKDDQLFKRLEDTFTSRSLHASLLYSDRVEVLPLRLDEPFLGFPEKRYNELREEVTIVQHCAWALDFNRPIDYFDHECIAPFYNLLKFAYRETNPMHVHFISSASASAAFGSEVLEEPLPLDAHVALPIGYGQSKFVVEVLLDYLNTEKNFPCYIERVGQLCGDSIHGIWNTSEHFPLMFIGGSSLMHKMPALDTVVDWLPVDYAAMAIVDIMLHTAYRSSNREESVYHIVNTHTLCWSDLLEIMKAVGMKFETVAAGDWLESLAKDDSNPAYALSNFYNTSLKFFADMPIWKTDKTSAIAPVIGKSPVLDVTLFAKFLNHWKSIGFYDPSK